MSGKMYFVLGYLLLPKKFKISLLLILFSVFVMMLCVLC